MAIINCKQKLIDMVNHLLFATTIFRDLPEMKWFAVTNFCDQALYTHCFFLLQLHGKCWFAVRNIHDNEALANLLKISRTLNTLVDSMSMELVMRCMFNINIHVFVLGISKNKLKVKTKTKNKIRTSSLCDNYIVFQKENLSNLPTSYIISFFIADFKLF